MASRRRVALAVGAGALTVAALIGCSSGETPQEAAGDYCEALDELNRELAELGDLVAQDATLDELNAQRESVSDAVDRANASAGAVDQSITEAIRSARGAFAAEIDDVPGDATVSEAAEAYKNALQGFVTVVADSFSQLSC